MDDKITSKQYRILEAVDMFPKTTVLIATWADMTPDSVQSTCRRLEDRQLIRRTYDKPMKWELTHTGRQALASPVN